MTKHLRFLFIALLMAVWTGGWAQTTVTFTASSDKSSTASLTKDGVTLTILKGTNNGIGKLDNGTDYRIYSGNKFSVSSSAGNITKIVFTCTANNNSKGGPGNLNNPTTGKYAYSGKTGTWTSTTATNTVTFNTSNQVKAAKIVVTVAPAKTDPALSFANASVDVALEDKTTTVQTITTAEGFDDSNITYESSDNNIATVAGKTINLIKEGEVNIIAKSPETETYAAGTASYKLVIKSNRKDPELAFKAESYNFDVNDRTFPSADYLDNPNSVAVKYFIDPTSNNAKIDENTGVAEIKEPGEYTITAKFAGDDTYKPATATCKLVVTNGKVVFYESFDGCDGTGGNNGQFSSTGTNDAICDNTGWIGTSVNAAAQCIKIGSGSKGGNITTPNITIDKVALLTFNLASWKGDKSNVTITISNGTLGYNGSLATSFTLTPSDSKFDNVEMIVKASSAFTINFSSNAKNQRFFLDEVKVTEIKAKAYTFNETSDNNIVENYENANVTLNRSHLVTDNWNTFCVPFAISAEEIATTWGDGTELRTFDRMSGNTMYFKKVESIEAGKPYLVKPTKDTDDHLTFNGVQTVVMTKAENTVGEKGFYMVGTYNAIKLKEDGSNLFLTTDNKFNRPIIGKAKMKGMRVYFEVPANTKPAELRANIDGVETGINAINGIEGNTTAPVYNLQGQCVGNSLRSLAPGIYVQGGKKFVVK